MNIFGYHYRDSTAGSPRVYYPNRLIIVTIRMWDNFFTPLATTSYFMNDSYNLNPFFIFLEAFKVYTIPPFSACSTRLCNLMKAAFLYNSY